MPTIEAWEWPININLESGVALIYVTILSS